MQKDIVVNENNQTNIEYISIYRLFNHYNIKLPFEKIANIYIGENGLGKTTILNIIYYLLSEKIDRLTEISFESIEIKFKPEQHAIIVSMSDFKEYAKNIISPELRTSDIQQIERLFDNMTASRDEKIFDNNFSISDDAFPIIRRISRMFDMPIPLIKQIVTKHIEEKKSDLNLDNNRKKGDARNVKRLNELLNKYVKQKILYLTTYRRIEDDYSKLNIDAELYGNPNNLIQFGMTDVLYAKRRILDKIRKETIDGFNKMAGDLLKQYATEKLNENVYKKKDIDINTVKLVLDRIGDEIDASSKDRIIKIINDDMFDSEKNYKSLMDLLEKLIKNYESQKEYDDRIKRFTDTCNKYLNGKKFIYNPSELTLEIYLESADNKTKIPEIIKLSQLSSGEKQIVSLFSKLYLERKNKTILIIDEPELSLSIKWQSMLLPDIVRSENCELLITVTHSPFIFDNEFDFDAREMKKYIEWNI